MTHAKPTVVQPEPQVEIAMVLATLHKNVQTGVAYQVEIVRQGLECVVYSSSLMAVQPSPKIALTFKTLDFQVSTHQPLA